MKKKDNSGFSLIELIIAVAILVVLSGLLAPQLIKYVERSREAKDVQMLDSVYVAVNTALTNEAAYDDFVDESVTDGDYAGVESGVTLGTIMSTANENNAFVKELKSILGKEASDLKLISKRAKGSESTENSIFVKVKPQTGGDDVKGLEVGVYAGKDAANPVDGFIVGNVN